MKINLAALPQDEMDKVNVDLAAAGASVNLSRLPCEPKVK